MNKFINNGVYIKKIYTATSNEWDQVWKDCDYATYFHSREWAEIWSEYTKSEIRLDPKCIIFNDGKKALIPLSYTQSLKGFQKNYVSSPAGTYGGWISLDTLNENHAVLLANFLTQKLDSISWRINPHDKIDVKKFIRDYREDKTYIFDLRDGFENIWKEWKKNGRHHVINRIQRKGFSVQIASDWDNWLEYFKTYQDSLNRWGDNATSKYRLELFEKMFKRKTPHIKLILCFDQKKIIAGTLIFYAKRHVVFWHSATLEEYYKYSPTTLLKLEAIKDACRKGYFWFDLNPSGGHKGVETYKKNLGAKPLSCPVVIVNNKSICSEFINKIAKFKNKLYKR